MTEIGKIAVDKGEMEQMGLLAAWEQFKQHFSSLRSEAESFIANIESVLHVFSEYHQ